MSSNQPHPLLIPLLSQKYPWSGDQLVLSLDSVEANRIAEKPSLVVLAEKCAGGAQVKDQIKNMVSKIAREWKGRQSGRQVLFYYSFKSNSRVGKQLRIQLGLDRPGHVPVIVLVDAYTLYDFNKFCEHERIPPSDMVQSTLIASHDGNVTESKLFCFMEMFNDGSLPKVCKTDDYHAATEKIKANVPQQSDKHEIQEEADGMDGEYYDSDSAAFSFNIRDNSSDDEN